MVTLTQFQRKRVSVSADSIIFTIHKENSMKLTWIVITDNVRARIFSAETLSSALEEIIELLHPVGRLSDREPSRSD